jgi:SUMO ligase MMS21 Smc5/6 complex component
MLLDDPPPQRPQQQQQQQQQCPNSLPKFVADLIIRNAAAEGARCPITMDPIEETEAFTVTACYHVFNAEALQRWLREHSNCPECNGRLRLRH